MYINSTYNLCKGYFSYKFCISIFLYSNKYPSITCSRIFGYLIKIYNSNIPNPKNTLSNQDRLI